MRERSGLQCPVGPAKLEAAYRSAKEMQALIAGISASPIPPWTPGLSADAERSGDFEKFNESLQRFSTESSILQDRASTGDEKRVAALYAEAVIDYTHSGALGRRSAARRAFSEDRFSTESKGHR